MACMHRSVAAVIALTVLALSLPFSLAIVSSIAEAHDGTLTLAPRAAGGLCVTVQLPATPPHTYS